MVGDREDTPKASKARKLSGGYFENVADVRCEWSLTTMSDFHLSKALLPICSQLSILGCDGARAETDDYDDDVVVKMTVSELINERKLYQARRSQITTKCVLLLWTYPNGACNSPEIG